MTAHEVLGEWHTTSWESCEPEKVFQAVDDSASRVITPTVGLQRRTLTCISANASVLPSRYVISGLYLPAHCCTRVRFQGPRSCLAQNETEAFQIACQLSSLH